MKQKKEKTTLQVYKKWKRISLGLRAGTILTPVIPMVVITAINWSDWFNTAGVSLPIGFTALLASTIGAIIGILKSDTVLKKKDMVLLCLGFVFIVLGLVNLWLASLIAQVGWIFFWTGLSCVGSYIEFTIEEKAVKPRVAEYKELVETYALDPKSAAKKQRKEKAKQEAEQKAQQEVEDKEKFGGLI